MAFGSDGAGERLKESMRGIASDLFSLEVNTILKGNMTGRKMPSLPHALIDIVRAYDGALCRMEAACGLGDGVPRVTEAGLAAFDGLRSRAVPLLGRGDPAGSDHYLLCRIKDNCDQLKGMFARQGLGEVAFDRAGADGSEERLALTHRQLVAVRKIWEIGTEEIMVQTVIQLDGDVVTRVHPDCLAPARQGLLKIHHDATATATGFWATLVELIGTFIGKLAGR